MATNLTTYLGTVRTTISGLTPVTQSPSSAFTLTSGLLGIDAEPQVFDRAFEVTTVDGGAHGPYMDASTVEWVQPYEVRVVYDKLANEQAGQDRILEDALRIRNALVQRANWGSASVQLVTYEGERRDPTLPGFEIYTLSFTVSVLETL